MIVIPLEIASEVGCSKNMLYKINRRLRFPALGLARRIIEAMAKRGEEIKITDLRPDLADFFNGASPDAGRDQG